MNENKLTEELNPGIPELKRQRSKQDILSNLNYDFTKLRSTHRPFGKFKRKIIFFLIFMLNILINVDHGAIPAATTILKKDLNLDNVSLGVIGSLVYLGLVLGATSAGPIFSAYSSKWVVSISLIISCIFLYSFTVATNAVSLSICRIGCGFFQVFCYIYFPVWVDQFGVNNNRTLWLTFLQLGVPVGTMVGYVLEAYCVNNYNDWRGCFYTQILFLLVGIVCLILTPDKFFSKHYKRSDTGRDEIEKEFEHLKTMFEAAPKHKKNSLASIHMINSIRDNKYGRPSQYSIYSLIDENDDLTSQSYYAIIKDLANNRVYLFTMMSICCLLFIITGIQFWISDYMQTVLHVNPKSVFITFAIVCITAPVFGVISGGYFIQKLGGYTSKRALDACFKISILAGLSGMFLPLINWAPLFVVLMWLLLFFGGSIVPGLTGIMLSSTPNKTKEIANSITHLCYNLFGYLPSPFLYGLVCKYTGGSHSRWGLAFILLWSYFGVFFLFLAKYYKNKATSKAPFESDSSTKEEDSTVDDSEIKTRKSLDEQANALTAIYGRLSLK